MIKRKNKFFTGIFSLIPGAGQMFMGFMKQGVSIMSLFFAILFLSSWLNIGPLMFAVPVLWFYSFFDAINKMSLDDEEFYAQEDTCLLSIDKFFYSSNSFSEKKSLVWGITLAVIGVYLLWTNFIGYFRIYMPGKVYDALFRFTNMFPQLAVGIIITVVGFKMIVGKKKENAQND